MSLRLRGLGHDVARCTIERLSRELGISDVTPDKGPRTTIADEHAERPTDRVDRLFAVNRPNELWCADFVRHEAMLNRGEVRDRHRPAVAAAG